MNLHPLIQEPRWWCGRGNLIDAIGVIFRRSENDLAGYTEKPLYSSSEMRMLAAR